MPKTPQSEAKDSSFGVYHGAQHADVKPFDLSTEKCPEDALVWNFILPVVPPQTIGLTPNSADGHERFNVRQLVSAMQDGAELEDVQQYICRFDDVTVRKHINDEVEGFPAMFYAVETNKESMLRLWVLHGGDVSVVHRPTKLPLLAFAIMHDETIRADTALITAALLNLGASPAPIPSAFYSPYLQDVPDGGPSNDSLKDLTSDQRAWCTDAARGKLARTCSLSQRYYLERAAKTGKPSIRQYQVAKLNKAEPLLGIANSLIGQNIATKVLLDTLLAHLTVHSKKPLVLVFAGPSGHGKTELARRLGYLLSLELEVVDCTNYKRDDELFGPRSPYSGAKEGSRLNNFLAKHHEQRCIVFLDEFEKTTPEVHKTMLLPFDNGESEEHIIPAALADNDQGAYFDRRNRDEINCWKTVWILATNAHDSIIQEFSATNKGVLSEDDQNGTKVVLKRLSIQLREDFQSHHGAPITGRISAFIPFLPFNVGEQAVIVHKALLELGRNVRQPVKLSGGPDEKVLGNVWLRVRRDASVCRVLAESEYHADLGARSLNTAVEQIKQLLVAEYLQVDEEITEVGRMSECTIDLSGAHVVVNLRPSNIR
ncbi:hypothetical protein LTR17_004412 [Elasticomyces elasticus]|nr:hypothetical protein LTR17_004412 [Elasticomyces elasticus]